MGEIHVPDQSEETPETRYLMDAYGQVAAVPSDDSWLFINDAMPADPEAYDTGEEAI